MRGLSKNEWVCQCGMSAPAPHWREEVSAVAAARRLRRDAEGGTDRDALAVWAERTGHRQAADHGRGLLRFAFYGRVSTEDRQDPVTSLARQREQAIALVAGRGHIAAEFLDIGQSRTLAWARRPQAAALVATLADPDRGWDAIVIGEYERAFYGGQYSAMAPLFEHYGVQLWTPEVGGRVDAGDHEQTMLDLGYQSKREITRTKIRVRAAMATQTRDQGRYLGGPRRRRGPRSAGPPSGMPIPAARARSRTGLEVPEQVNPAPGVQGAGQVPVPGVAVADDHALVSGQHPAGVDRLR